MVRVLCFLNVSNKDNLSTDSAYIFYNTLVKDFLNEDIDFLFASPRPLSNENIKHIPFDFGNSKYAVRFNFNWDKIEQIIKQENPDVLLINQIELIPNYKALIEHLELSTIKIIGYAHYIPYFFQKNKINTDTSLNAGNINETIQLSFLSGILSADVIFTHSKTSLQNIKSLLEKYNKSFNPHKFIINPPPKDPLFIYNSPNEHSNRIIYNHRLYEHYGTSFLLETISNLNQIGDFEFEIFDILGNRDTKRKRLDTSVEKYRQALSKYENVTIRVDGNNRDIYKEAFNGALCCLAPYRKGTPWSMSCIDSMALGIPCVAPKFDWFKEFMPNELLYSSPKKLVEIIQKLNSDLDFWLAMSKKSYECTKKLTSCKIAKKFISEFKREKTCIN